MGRPSQVSPNQLQSQFQQDEDDQVLVTDITYIRTNEGWLYLAVVARLALKGGGRLEHKRQHGDHAGAGRVNVGCVAPPA